MTHAERPWFQHYDPSTPREIAEFCHPDLRALFDEANQRFAAKTAFVSGDLHLTYAEVERHANHLAAWLSQSGVGKGDRVAVMAPNILAFPVALFANVNLGVVQVNVNPLYTPHELEHQLNDAGVETIVVWDGSLPTLRKVLGDTSIRTVIVAHGADPIGGTQDVEPIADGIRTVALATALAEGEDLCFERPPIDAEDLLFLQYTGGTTGLSKGAMLSHRNLMANITQYDAFAGDRVRAGEEVVLTAIPLYHIFALMVNTLVYYRYGGTNVLIANPRDLPGLVAQWKRWPVSVFTGVNTLFNGLVHTPEFAELDLSSLRDTLGGGAPVQEAVSERWKALSGAHIREGYGLSETSPVLTATPHGRSDFRCSIGIPIPGTDLSLRDDDGNEVAQGERGEVCARGPQVMQGYWKRPDATAEVMTEDGYFRTGDIGVMDEDGFFHIVDRKKDMILVSGFNVFPNEIEAAVAFMPGIVEGACVGVPDDKTGEAARLFCVRNDDSLTEDQVRGFLRERLAAYKVPRDVVFLEELPRSTVGKILRRELRDRAIQR